VRNTKETLDKVKEMHNKSYWAIKNLTMVNPLKGTVEDTVMNRERLRHNMELHDRIVWLCDLILEGSER